MHNTARSLNNYYYGDFSELAGPFTAEGNFECNVVPGIEQQLGETGRFVAKDWRPDQTNKYAELESGFRSKAAEILTTPDNLSPQDKAALEKYTTIVLPSKIKDRFKAQDTSTIPELSLMDQTLTLTYTIRGTQRIMVRNGLNSEQHEKNNTHSY